MTALGVITLLVALLPLPLPSIIAKLKGKSYLAMECYLNIFDKSFTST